MNPAIGQVTRSLFVRLLLIFGITVIMIGVLWQVISVINATLSAGRGNVTNVVVDSTYSDAVVGNETREFWGGYSNLRDQVCQTTRPMFLFMR